MKPGRQSTSGIQSSNTFNRYLKKNRHLTRCVQKWLTSENVFNTEVVLVKSVVITVLFVNFEFVTMGKKDKDEKKSTETEGKGSSTTTATVVVQYAVISVKLEFLVELGREYSRQMLTLSRGL